MAIDRSTFEGSLRRKKGLLESLGDAGRFLTNLFGSDEVSQAAIKKTVGDLEQYEAGCFDQIDDLGQQWQKTHGQIADLKRRMADAPPPIRETMLAQAEVLLRRYDGYRSALSRLKANGLSTQVLLEKLRDLLILADTPMTENAIDEWATHLDGALQERQLVDTAVADLEKMGQEEQQAEPASKEIDAEKTQARIDELTEAPTEVTEPDEVEKRLLEEF